MLLNLVLLLVLIISKIYLVYLYLVLDMLIYLSLLIGLLDLLLQKGLFILRVVESISFLLFSLSPQGIGKTRQRSHATLFEAFKLIFNTNRKIEDDGKHMKFSVSSTKDLINVVTFTAPFQGAGNSGLYSLLGLKADQYNAWLTSLKQNNKKFKI